MEEDRSIFEMEVDHVSGEEILDTSRWQHMLGWLVILCLGLLLAGMLFGWDEISVQVNQAINAETGRAAMVFVAIVLILVVVIGAVLAGLLIRGATRMKTAIRTRDQFLFTDGLRDLKMFFIIYGVLSIIGLLGNLASLF